MYSYFKGKLVEKTPTDAIIDCNGVAYQLNISLQTFTAIKDQEDCKLFAHLVVREDAQTLYGFATIGERAIFRQLISVSGVGANTARMILSSMTKDEVFNAILSDNAAALQAVKGIGGKTAKRIILDLKDKIAKDGQTAEILSVSHNTNKEEALSALVMLGFARNTADKALNKVIKTEGLSLTIEELIRLALKNL
ncbi:MAG: Holliday junction branch migration protein RuvA [Bacteroidetes bacterium]|nr:MAG: Holliday junction branch migration protein RuvA [Bacteroidota bacterium]